MSNWWYATSVDVEQSSNLVRVNTGDDARYFERGSCWLKIAGHDAVETDGLITDGADTFIRLVKDWSGNTDTGRRAFAFRTVPDFQGVADKLALNIEASQGVVDNVISKMGTVLTSTDESVVIETAEGDVEVVPYGRLKADIEQQFNEFVDARQQQIDDATSKVDAFNLEQSTKRRATIYSDFAGNFHRLYNPTTKRIVETDLEENWTVERASAAWGFNASGRLVEYAPDEPRLVIDPETGESKGVMIEEQRTNLFPWSKKMDTSFINPGSDVEVETAELFGQDAIKLICTEDGGSVSAAATRIQWNPTAQYIQGNTYAISGYLEGDGTSVEIRFGPSTNDKIRIDLDTKEVVEFQLTTSGLTAVSTKIETFPNDIIYWEAVFNCTATTNITNHAIAVTEQNVPVVFSLHQIEVGSVGSSRILTDGTSVTRTADTVVRTLGAEFNQQQGTLFFKIEVPIDFSEQGLGGSSIFALLQEGGSVTSPVLSLVASTTKGRMLLRYRSNTNVAIDGISGKTLSIAVKYDSNSARFYVNGKASDTLAKGSSTDDALLFIVGGTIDGVPSLQYECSQVRYLPYALSDAELQELSKL